MATNYQVDYEDQRLQQVEADKKAALTQTEKTYGGMIDSSDQFYEAQIQASKDWAQEQTKLQQEQTDFSIEQIEQQKEQAQKDYTKEQSGAYVDWKKQSQQHGTNAEQLAAQGMQGTGFSESSKVGMYNTYQNRVAAARETYGQAVMNYNNAIKEARLQNNATLAEIAYQALQQQLELSLQGFQYKNTLLIEQANKKTEQEQLYHQRYLDVLGQINTEHAMAEQIRQYDQNYQLQVQAQQEEIRQYNEQMAEQIRQFDEEIARLKANDAHAHKMDIQQLELQKQELAEQIRQYDQNYQLQVQAQQEEIRQFNAQLTEEKRQFEQSYALKVREFDEGIRQFNAEIARLKANDAHAHKMDIQQLELQRDKLKEEQKQFQESMKEEQRQFDLSQKEKQRQFDEQMKEEQRQFDAQTGGIDLTGGEEETLAPDDPRAIGSIEGVGFSSIDHDSVRAITGGTIYSASGVESKIKSGEWLYVIENGVLIVEKNPNYPGASVQSRISGDAPNSFSGLEIAKGNKSLTPIADAMMRGDLTYQIGR